MTAHSIGRMALVPTLLLLPLAALAHGNDPSHDHGLMLGLLHPLGGLDHLLAMLTVGLWAALALTGGRRLAAPLLFVVALLAGAVLARLGLAALSGLLEPAIALSVLLLGALLAGGSRIGAAAGLGLVAAAGMLHGIAHGLEAAPGGGFAAYAVGFVAATAALHAAGLAAGAWLVRAHAAWLRSAGVLVGVAGAMLALGRL